MTFSSPPPPLQNLCWNKWCTAPPELMTMILTTLYITKVIPTPLIPTLHSKNFRVESISVKICQKSSTRGSPTKIFDKSMILGIIYRLVWNFGRGPFDRGFLAYFCWKIFFPKILRLEGWYQKNKHPFTAACKDKTTPLASKTCRELQQRVFVEI